MITVMMMMMMIIIITLTPLLTSSVKLKLSISYEGVWGVEV
jgi:hypothetical protein